MRVKNSTIVERQFITLQRPKTKNFKQIFPEKELRVHSPNILSDPGNISIAHRRMNVEIGTDAAQLPEKEYIQWDFPCSAAD